MAGRVTFTDLGLGAIIKEVQALKNTQLSVGVVGEPARAPHGDSGLTNGEIAVIQHFGTEDGHIPPRHFVSLPLYRNRAFVVEQMTQVARAVVNKKSGPRALAKAGERLAGLVKAGMRDGSTTNPQAAASTVAHRSQNTRVQALIDTSQLYEAVGFELVHGSPGSIDSDPGDE